MCHADDMSCKMAGPARVPSKGKIEALKPVRATGPDIVFGNCCCRPDIIGESAKLLAVREIQLFVSDGDVVKCRYHSGTIAAVRTVFTSLNPASPLGCPCAGTTVVVVVVVAAVPWTPRHSIPWHARNNRRGPIYYIHVFPLPSKNVTVAVAVAVAGGDPATLSAFAGFLDSS